MRRYFGRETIVYLAALVLSVLAFVLMGNTGAGIIAAMLILYAALAVVMTFAGGRALTVRLTAQGEQAKGIPARAAMLLRNRSWFPVFRCDAVITAENLLTGVRSNTKLVCGILPKKSRVSEFTVGDACCGEMQLQLERLTVGDPLRILFREIPAKDVQTEILIRPEIAGTGIRTELLDQYDMESFRYADNRVGSDTSETVSIREYADGDSMRSIHWKLSAKTDDLLVREPGFPIDNRLMVIADKRLSDPDKNDNSERQDRLTKITELTEAALAVSFSLAGRGIRHRFGWHDLRQDIWRTEDITATEDVIRILRSFLSSPVQEDEMDAAQHFLGAETEKNFSTYLLVTPDEAGSETGIMRLREYGYVTVYSTEEYRQEMD